jgi:ribosomal protein S27E
MERDKEAELKELKEKEERDKKRARYSRDVCPVCTFAIDLFPYVHATPDGRITCTACGTVFVPRSLRDKMMARANDDVQDPGPALWVPK